jgi:hypothetical protein
VVIIKKQGLSKRRQSFSLSQPTWKECSYRFLTVPVDEFMTTKMYNGDKQTVLKAVQRRDTGATVVRGLLWCDSSSTKDQSKFVNRDLNAALNNRDCFLARSRPAMLSRSEDNNIAKAFIYLG